MCRRSCNVKLIVFFFFFFFFFFCCCCCFRLLLLLLCFFIALVAIFVHWSEPVLATLVERDLGNILMKFD